MKTCTLEEYLFIRTAYCMKTFGSPDASNVILNQRIHLKNMELMMDSYKAQKAVLNLK